LVGELEHPLLDTWSGYRGRRDGYNRTTFGVGGDDA
jgi:hypothetical protein